jgi:hypothetical protein
MDMYHLGDTKNLVALVALIVLTMGPFFFAGLSIAELISRAGPDVHRIYFFDLIGSAAGSLMALVLVNTLGGVAACVVGGAVAIGSAALLAPRGSIIYLAVAVALVALSPFSEKRSVLPLAVPPGKQLFGQQDSIEAVRWHVITRLDVSAPMDCKCSFGGSLSLTYDGPASRARLVFQDGSNLTGIVQPTPTPERSPIFGYYLQGAAYTIRPRADALVIGSGGGIDVMVGLHHGARHLVAVDVNPEMMRLVRETYANFAGHVFERPDVEPIVSEGRHFLSRDPRQFDVIQLSGVDTWAAQACGAYALTENFIYTAEAFDAYLAHLRPDGIVGFSRPHVEPPLEAIRLSTTALGALERAGEEEAFGHLYILAGQGQASDAPWAEVLVKRSAFTRDESADLRDWAEGRGFEVAFDPFAPQETELDGFVRSSMEERERMYRTYPFEVRPVADDAPFYFQFDRWRDFFGERPPPMAMWILAGSCVEVLVLSFLLIVYPLVRRGSAGNEGGGRAGIFFYFASLGIGFIFVEIALLQKLTVFLGGPAYAMSITLSTLLVASGTGSMLSERGAADPHRFIVRMTPILFAIIVVEAFSLDSMMHWLMGLSLVGRALTAALWLAPLGLAMGTLFPMGLRHVDLVRPDLTPWAWGINACATVVGTSGCMLLVSAFGFRAALLAGATAYLLGALGLRGHRAVLGPPLVP